MGDRLEPQNDLLEYFERSTGQRIRTRADLERYLDCAAEIRPLWLHVNRAPEGWALVKQILLVVLFVIAAFEYIYLDAALDIASMPSTIYFLTPSS